MKTYVVIARSERLPGSNPGVWLTQHSDGHWSHLRDAEGKIVYTRDTDQFEAIDIAGWDWRNAPGSIDNGEWTLHFRPSVP